MTPLELARFIHDRFEVHAPRHGYSRPEMPSAFDPERRVGRIMVDVARDVLDALEGARHE